MAGDRTMEQVYKGQWVLVTGAGKPGRVGEAIALYFAERAAGIYLHYRSSKSDAEEVKRRIEAAAPGAQIVLVQGDLARVDDVEKIFKDIAPAIVINNAAAFKKVVPGATLAEKEKIFDEQLAANAKSAYLVTEAALAAWQRAGVKGVGIFVGDAFLDEGGVYGEGLEAYVISKAHVRRLTREYANEYGSMGHRFNAIMNGPVERAPSASDAAVEALRADIPAPPEKLKPLIGGAAVARAIGGLVDSGTNGTVFSVDYGRSWRAPEEHSVQNSP